MPQPHLPKSPKKKPALHKASGKSETSTMASSRIRRKYSTKEYKKLRGPLKNQTKSEKPKERKFLKSQESTKM